MIVCRLLVVALSLTRVSLAEEGTCAAGDESCAASDGVNLQENVQNEPEIEWSAIRVEIDRSDGMDLGAELIMTEETLQIETILSEGAIMRWNQNNPKSDEIRVGDHIVEVNGINGPDGATSEELLAELEQNKSHLVWIMFEADEERKNLLPAEEDTQGQLQRAILQEGQSEWIVILDRSKGEELGLTFQQVPQLYSLVVDAVDDKNGVVASWNRRNPEKALKAGDQIVEVNGFYGSTVVMADEIEQSKRHFVMVFGDLSNIKTKDKKGKKDKKDKKASKDKTPKSQDTKKTNAKDSSQGKTNDSKSFATGSQTSAIQEMLQPYLQPIGDFIVQKVFQEWLGGACQYVKVRFKMLWKFLSSYAGQSFELCWVLLSILACVVVLALQITIELFTFLINLIKQGSLSGAWDLSKAMAMTNLFAEEEDEFDFEYEFEERPDISADATNPATGEQEGAEGETQNEDVTQEAQSPDDQ